MCVSAENSVLMRVRQIVGHLCNTIKQAAFWRYPIARYGGTLYAATAGSDKLC